MLFIGPSLLSGIGQVVQKYAKLFGSKYQTIEDEIPNGESVFMFALPIEPWLSKVSKISNVSKRLICMTVCETETVHPLYGELFDRLKGRPIAVPSQFCADVFKRQFPEHTFKIIRHYVPLPKQVKPQRSDPYIFYHIGNVLDPRKNVKKILEAFVRLNIPETFLVLKATCKEPVNWNFPRVKIINGLVSDAEIQGIHETCHCYVSFSSSEGVGMGAVEAAMHDKPVIITRYGAQCEYIKTPYVVDCELQEIPQDDFLYQKGMKWGKPNFNQLMEHMKDAFDQRLYRMNHSHTKQFVSVDSVISDFTSFDENVQVDVVCEVNNKTN